MAAVLAADSPARASITLAHDSCHVSAFGWMRHPAVDLLAAYFPTDPQVGPDPCVLLACAQVTHTDPWEHSSPSVSMSTSMICLCNRGEYHT